MQIIQLLVNILVVVQYN